jgi:hypothetical protein
VETSETSETAETSEPNVATFSFVNTYINKITKGYGIMNTFKYTGGGWKWKNDIGGGNMPKGEKIQ